MTDDISQATQAEEAQPKTEDTLESENAEKKAETVPIAPENVTEVEKAQGILDGMRHEREEFMKLVRRQEAATARIMLGGRGVSGGVKKTPEETERERIEREVSNSVNRFD